MRWVSKTSKGERLPAYPVMDGDQKAEKVDGCEEKRCEASCGAKLGDRRW